MTVPHRSLKKSWSGNRIFLAMAISRGMDSAIVDVLDQPLMNVVATSEMLMNKQIYSDSFLKVY